MGALFIDHRDAALEYANGALTVRLPDVEPRRIPVSLLRRVVIRGDAKLSARVLTGLAESGVAVLLQTGRGGAQTACLIGRPGADVQRRLLQARRAADITFATNISCRLVRAKAAAQCRLLRHAIGQRPDARKPLYDAIATITLVMRRIADAPPDIESLRGYEGAAAAAYFRAYSVLFADSLGFTARRRRPPPDPVNAALSLGYTLLYAMAVQACHRCGLDPMVGFLHSPAHDRASLACDLMEPWRPTVDQWVWNLFRKRVLVGEHFSRLDDSSCLLGKAGRQHFYAAWAERSPAFERALRRHSRWTLMLLEGTDPVTLPGLVPSSAMADA